MDYEKSCGAVVFRKSHGNVEILLIKHLNGGYWSFPKGHVEAGETEEETAIREVKEETNIDIIIDSTFREVVTYSPKKDTMKDVVYFLARAKNFDHIPQITEIAQVKWVELSLAHSALTYDNDKQLINKARAVIKESL
ncbi:MAG: NUDIX domain-containing protein [Oscillospiraceae bacterium]|nr:NUDIX domain-containing protein [Oscillospiraceae bacterium]